MEKRKGVVMGLEGKKAIVYTEEGEFVRLSMPRKVPKPGDVIEVGSGALKPLASYFAVAATLVLVVAISIFYYIFGSSAAAAYVALDMNPSLQLAVNRDGTVIKAQPLNKEANSLLADVNVDGQNVYSAVDSIVREAGKRGYIGKGQENMVLAGIVPVNGNIPPVVQEDKLRQVIQDELMNMHVSGEVVANEDIVGVNEQAAKTGLSVNKYMVYEQSRQEDINISMDALRGNNVLKVLEQSGITLKKLFPTECVEVRQPGQLAVDSGVPVPTQSGIKTEVDEVSHSSGMGHGSGYSGATGNMDTHGPGGATPESGMVPSHQGSQPSVQPGGMINSQRDRDLSVQSGGTEKAQQNMGGNMSHSVP